MQVRDLVRAMERIAPRRYAEDWDRVGLQVGRPDAELQGPVLLTIDLTERVLGEALQIGASAVVAYHPLIWDPMASITGDTARGRIVLGAAEAGVSVYVPHTALDAVPGGISDWLCEVLSGSEEPGRIAGDCRSLEAWAPDGAKEVKLVVFVPQDAAERVRNALATAGAGRIGEYELCSFGSPGIGTFRGGESTDPAIGEAGQFETVEEVRMEMVCPRAALPLAIETLKHFHPYEEPAFDVYELASKPERRVGVGRRLVLDQAVELEELADRLKRRLGRARVRATAGVFEGREIRSIGVVPGAGESLAGRAVREECELFVTGEMRHHQILDALHHGLGVLLAGHTNTERGYLPRLGERIERELPGVSARLASGDEDLLSVM